MRAYVDAGGERPLVAWLSFFFIGVCCLVLQALLENVGKWDFDVFALTRLSGGTHVVQ